MCGHAVSALTSLLRAPLAIPSFVLRRGTEAMEATTRVVAPEIAGALTALPRVIFALEQLGRAAPSIERLAGVTEGTTERLGRIVDKFPNRQQRKSIEPRS